ncbi:MAG: SAF domain-containing protein [Solirubrobacterales bacterium]
MSRRARAGVFALAALVAAGLAAAIADGYGNSVARGYGELRPVAVATQVLRRGETIDPARAAAALETRRVPLRFIPAGALRSPAEAIGLAPTAAVPAGAYLLAAQLRPPRSAAPDSRLAAGRRPVPITVSGATALAAEGVGRPGAIVDVVVTTEPTTAGHGRTYVAAAGVPLLALAPTPDGVEAAATATLALTRGQALRLIAAESFARQLTLLPGAR